MEDMILGNGPGLGGAYSLVLPALIMGGIYFGVLILWIWENFHGKMKM